jgi:FdhD protein
MTSGSFAIDINRHSRGSRADLADRVAVEEPLEIRIAHSTPEGRAHRSISITMRTPGNDDELAAGFLFTETIVSNASEIVSIEACAENVVRVELHPDVAVDLGQLQRHFYTTSSCGVCGKASLEALRVSGIETLDPSLPTFKEAVLIAVPERLRASQPTFEATGGLHAAACFDKYGELLVTMEDVGRHNAVDKVIGRLLLEDRLPAGEFGLMVSGRASFELVQKSLVAGIPLLAAVGAPSSLAVEVAREFNMTLIGFLRGNTFNVYAGGERLGT